ncbi:MAG TPA: hypothetical protein VFL54_09045 [Gammaproteobacteria bacterium]|nr:hypothetical protein [Gammaproteobacteria bacterium]
MTSIRNINAYLRLARWAKRRYARDGYIALDVGGEPTLYSRIESAAARKYLGVRA